MDFQFTSEQTLFKESVDRFIDRLVRLRSRAWLSPRATTGFSREHWRQFAELGWLGIAFSEEHGGFGGSPVETMILMEAFGKGLVLEPFVPAIVLGGTALAWGATSVGAARAAGEALIAGRYAAYRSLTPKNARATITDSSKRALAARGATSSCDGAKRTVPYGAAADRLVVSVRTRRRRLRDPSMASRSFSSTATQRAFPAPIIGRWTVGRASDVTVRRRARRHREDVLGELGRGPSRCSIARSMPASERSAPRRSATMSVMQQHDARVSQNARAVRRSDRLVPSTSAPRGRHADPTRARPVHHVCTERMALDRRRAGRASVGKALSATKVQVVALRAVS